MSIPRMSWLQREVPDSPLALTEAGPKHLSRPLLDRWRELLRELCHKPLIEKTRYKIPFDGFIWEVDEFAGENEGLIFAEIELKYEGEIFSQPHWIGKEVTDDPRYYNANLVNTPYRDW